MKALVIMMILSEKESVAIRYNMLGKIFSRGSGSDLYTSSLWVKYAKQTYDDIRVQ